MSVPLLVSHHLCPYVQRAAIVAAEKGITLRRETIDLANKPAWFTALSPTGKVPLLRVTDESGAEHALFESAAIAEYLDETGPAPCLMPTVPLARARTRAWVEFASTVLSDIAGLYNAAPEAFPARVATLQARFRQVEQALTGPWFAGPAFGLVDAAFGPVFRYLDCFEQAADLHLTAGLPGIAAWRSALAGRPSVASAAPPDYPARLRAFLLARRSHLSGLVATQA